MFSSNTTQVFDSAPDPQFNYVTMLLHGDGTNGAQNNTFVDSSTNNFTITRNGNTTQGSFSPYGSNWSNYLPNSGSIQYSGVSTALQFTGDFTIEGWFNVANFNNAPAGGNPGLIGNGTPNWVLLVTNGGEYHFYASGSIIIQTSTAVASANVWNHFALVRSGSTLKIYHNGVSVATATNSATLSIGSNVTVGSNGTGGIGSILGYISNVRVVKGTAVYTANFTPPTTPLTAISGTQLLAAQSNRFIDSSSNNFSATIETGPSVQRFNPFGTATAYSTSVIGGSGYFDGTGDYLSIAPATAIDVSTGDFTLEFWANPTQAKNSVDSVFGYGSFTMMIYHTGSDWSLEVGNGSSNYFTLSTSRNLNAWTHIAITRSGNNFTFWKNGVSSATATNSGTIALSSKTLTIGWNNNTSQPSQVFTGYINDFRIVKGTALYTTAFTPPTAPLTAITNTSLLTNFTNGAIFDNAMMNDLETVGNAQISTSVVKYGTGSLAFDGTGDYLYRPNSDLFAFNTGDFTVEFWMYANSTANEKTVMGTASGYRTGGWQIGFNFSATVPNAIQVLIESNPQVIVSSAALSTATWYYIAATRSGSTLRLFVNGTQVSSATSSSNISDSAGNALAIGRTIEGIAGRDYNGYIDDLRITKGYARYTANFTAPTSAFSNTGPV